MRGDRIVLKVEGLGHVPSMKNSKMLTRGRLITKPEYQEWIARCIRSFESQLASLLATGEAGMLTGPSPQSLMPWLSRFDDSVQWIISEHCEVMTVDKGDEGAIVVMEEL